MPQPPKIFVSFSSRDIAVARRLFYSLKSQLLDVWDYSRPGEEIPLGTRIQEVLERQIDGCDYVIALLSANSMDPAVGRFTRHEIEYAIARGVLARGRLLPLQLAGSRPLAWSGVYEQLHDRLFAELDPGDRRKYEETIALVCRRLEWPYTPPFLGDPRLPFAGRFEREVAGMQKALPNAVFVDLMSAIDDFVHAYNGGDWPEAERLIAHFLLLWRYKVRKPEPYYPRIIQGVCQLHLGRFAEAEETFFAAARHPAHDENCFGGLGQVYVRTGRYVEAQAAFEMALEVCPPDRNWEIRFNLLGCRMESGAAAGDEGLFDGVDLDAMQPDDRKRILTLKGIFLLQRGDPNAALEAFDSLCDRQLADPVVAAYRAIALERTGRIREAIASLKQETVRFDDTSLYHRLADLLLKAGQIAEALAVYQDKLCTPERRKRQYLTEYARILVTTDGDPGGSLVSDLCRTVLSRASMGYPRTSEDFYYDGFANYMTGRHERARYDFERSSGFCDVYYSDLLR
jgi:tetratricopeptide (TPR) repeat protein